MDEKNRRKELLLRAQRICSAREYCISDVRSLLERWGADDEQTKTWVIDRLKEDKFIDEQRYCRAFVLDHFRHSQWGKVKITMSLKSKNIPASVIASGLEAIDNQEYLALLKKIISDHRRTVRAKNRFDLKGKLLRYALGKGFESSLVYEIINSGYDD